ncbi:MAG: hypothetical protein GXP55_15730 [Deltaproteobacteria bacterium]|nr:hypothetical protein [Deltaproteobacteria bacterium]
MPKVEGVLISRSPFIGLPFLLLASLAGCGQAPITPPSGDAPGVAPSAPSAPPAEAPRVVDTRPPPLAEPVPLWADGETTGPVDAATARADGYLLLDLGEEWTPYLFTERERPSDELVPNAYRETFLALARGDFPNDWHGDRARRDKYLELYGIMPTLGLLRERMRRARQIDCFADIDTTPLSSLDAVLVYRSNDRARRNARRFRVLSRQIEALVARQGVEDEAALDSGELSDSDASRLDEYREIAPRALAIRAAQEVLRCEGYFEGKASPTPAAFDWVTHQALAEFERKSRIYGWGFLGPDTRAALVRTPPELEREAVIRVLTERAMHAAGVIEDGSMSELRSGEARTFEGADGQPHPIPNLEADLRARVIEAFGLDSAESTSEWLEGLGELAPDQPLQVAIGAPVLPEYYSADMDLSVTIDRGDVWYDFPYDNEGREHGQPTRRRPKETIYVTYLGQRIPLARYGTTIGGWRTENVDGTLMWSYKESPVGPRVWTQIVASPVWMPPDSTPVRSLLHRKARGVGADRYEVNYYETGPSYASAYGLVAAYHRTFRRREDGTIVIGGDEGIRNHGSVDYMSIMRRHSHGCHRLHNHIAVRLMSFVLDHRPHHRVGQQRIAFHKELEYEGNVYQLDLDHGGYVFTLDQPLIINVLRGRIRGHQQTPIEHPMPKYDSEAQGYLMPDGQRVSVSSDGTLTPLAPPPDAGVLSPDAGVPALPGAIPAPDPRATPVPLPPNTPLGRIVLPPAAP